jgi:hypothetical protein
MGMWTHKTKPTKFCLCVDDFGVKYFNKEDASHLINALKASGYAISIDMKGENYCGLKLEWNYKEGYVDISMPGYVQAALHKFQHKPPARPCRAPHKWNTPVYGRTTQFAKEPDSSGLLPHKSDITRIQSIVGTFLYYARAVDSPLLPALNEIGTQQSKPTKSTNQAANTLMDFAATYPDAKVRFYASDMILHVDTDAAYLVLPKARSRVAGYFYLSSLPSLHGKPRSVPLNGAILVECATIRTVVGSAAEAECAGCYHNAQRAIPIRIALEELGHPQPRTPVKTDNITTQGFVNKSMRQKRSKSWDMKYHWLRCRSAQGQFIIYWDKGSNNHADYYTKHFPPSHHIIKRPQYILKNHCTIQNIRSSITHALARVC